MKKCLFNRCISGLMSNLIKESCTVSRQKAVTGSNEELHGAGYRDKGV